MPRLARAEGRDPRFLTIVLRGALDGLAAVAPVGDPDWIKLRGDNALRLDGKTPALPLDGFFALNPAMPNLHRLYQAGQATIVHAVATPYRDRSHFDGQDVLESGLPKPGARRQRLAQPCAGRAGAGEPVNPRGRQAFAVGPVTPLVVRGPASVVSWTPPRLPPVSEETTMRLLELYRHTDPTLARVLEDRLGLAAIVRASGMADNPDDNAPAVQVGGIAQVRAYFADAAGAAAKFLATPGGPRIGALALDGWDTHVNEGAVNGRLADLLGALDGAIAAIKTNMGEAWSETVVALITEFGRTARMSTATKAPITAPGRSRCSPAGRSRAAASSPIGRASRKAISTRSAISRPPPTCAPCSRASSRITCASMTARSRPTSSRAAKRRPRWRGCWPELLDLSRQLNPLGWRARRSSPSSDLIGDCEERNAGR